jgi:hypothetical protein
MNPQASMPHEQHRLRELSAHRRLLDLQKRRPAAACEVLGRAGDGAARFPTEGGSEMRGS